MALDNLEVVLPLQKGQKNPHQRVATTYTYQRRNLRNFILFMRSRLEERKDWIDWYAPFPHLQSSVTMTDCAC